MPLSDEGRLIRPSYDPIPGARRVCEFQQHPTRAFHDFSSVRIRFKRRSDRFQFIAALDLKIPEVTYDATGRVRRRRTHRRRRRARRTTTHRPRVTAAASGPPETRSSARPLAEMILVAILIRRRVSRTRAPSLARANRVTTSRRVDVTRAIVTIAIAIVAVVVVVVRVLR